MPGDEGLLAQSEIEALFAEQQRQAAASRSSAEQGNAGPTSVPQAADKINPVGVTPFRLEEVSLGGSADDESTDVRLILDVDLNVRVELGRSRMFIEDVLKLREGSVVALDKLAGDPVDIYVNGRLMARGEVLVLNDNFCVRISEILGDGSEVQHAEE